jgi:hypothetical protein
LSPIPPNDGYAEVFWRRLFPSTWRVLHLSQPLRHGSRIKPDARANPERRNLPSIFGSTALSEHQALFFPAFTFVHRALRAAAISLRETAESFRLLRIGTILSALPAFALTFAQHAFWAAAIRARAAAESLRRPVPFTYALPNAARAAPMPRSSLVNRSCSFFNRRTTPAKSSPIGQSVPLFFRFRRPAK